MIDRNMTRPNAERPKMPSVVQYWLSQPSARFVAVGSAPLAFDRLRPDSVETRILRDRPPFTVATEARFGRIDVTLQDWFDGLGLIAETTLLRRGRERTLSVVIRVAEEEAEGDDALAALVEELGAYRFVVAQERFLDANGFTLSDDETIAIPVEPTDEELEEARRTDGTIEYVLTWTTPR